MAYADEIAAANRLKDRDARFEARNAVRAKYGMEPEKRKRGGIAGLYDRNKAVVQAAVPTLAGMFIPGGAIAGAVAGGLARGLDRPGKSGIGLDLGQAAQGALTGAALGGAGEFLGGKMGVGPAGAAMRQQAAQAARGTEAFLRANAGGVSAGVPAAAPAAAPGAAAPIDVSGATQIPGRTAAPIAPPAVAPTTRAGSPPPTQLSRILTGAKEYAPLIQATATPLAAVIGGSMEQDIEARKIQLQEEQFRREQEARDRLAQLLMPMFQQQAGRVRPMTTPRG